MSNTQFTRLAKRDLEEIYLYTKYKWSSSQAEKYIKLILNKIDDSVNNYGITIRMNGPFSEYRYCELKSHLIFFRKTSQEEIKVVRILHNKMDILSILNNS